MSRSLPPPRLTSHGEGEPVLMLHGLGAMSSVFDLVRRQLSPGFRAITVDLPNHGPGGAWAALEPKAVAQRLAEVLPSEPFYVLGHSFGGVTALELAALMPERVRGLCIAAAPAMGLGPLAGPLKSKFADWTMKIASQLKPSAAAVRAYLRFVWRSEPGPTPGQIQSYLMAMDAEGHHAASLTALRALATYEVPSAPLSSIPTSIIFGERDPLVPLVHGDRLAKLLGADLHVARGAGHCLLEERPAEVAAIVRRDHARLLARSA